MGNDMPTGPTVYYGAINSVNTVKYQWNSGSDSLSGYREDRYCINQLGTINCIPTNSSTSGIFLSAPGTGALQTRSGTAYKIRLMTVDKAGNQSAVTESAFIRTGLYLYLSPTAQQVTLKISIYDNSCNSYSTRPDATANYRALMYTSTQSWSKMVPAGWAIYNSSGQMMFTSTTNIPTALAAPISYSASGQDVMVGYDPTPPFPHPQIANCNDWVSPSIFDFTHTGWSNSTGSTWFQNNNPMACSGGPYYHYCIQLPR